MSEHQYTTSMNLDTTAAAIGLAANAPQGSTTPNALAAQRVADRARDQGNLAIQANASGVGKLLQDESISDRGGNGRQSWQWTTQVSAGKGESGAAARCSDEPDAPGQRLDIEA